MVTLALAYDIDEIAERSRLVAEGLAGAPAAQQRALHLDDRVPGAQGQPQGHPRLGRSGQGGRPGHHAQPEDLGRRALELSGGLGLCAAPATAATSQGAGVRRQALSERAGARHRRARLDHDLRPARHRRRAARLGERGLPRARGARARTSSRSSCRRSASWPSRRWRWSTTWSTSTARARWPRPIWSTSTRRPARSSPPSTTTGRRARAGRPGRPRALPRDRAGHRSTRCSAAGRRRRPHFADGGVFDQIATAVGIRDARAAPQAAERPARLRADARLHPQLSRADRADPARRARAQRRRRRGRRPGDRSPRPGSWRRSASASAPRSSRRWSTPCSA